MKNKEEVLEKVDGLLYGLVSSNRYLFQRFLSLLFWKDFEDGHITAKILHDIFSEIEKATKETEMEGDIIYSLDTEKILPFINKMRKQINLPTLIQDKARQHIIMEEHTYNMLQIEEAKKRLSCQQASSEIISHDEGSNTLHKKNNQRETSSTDAGVQEEKIIDNFPENIEAENESEELSEIPDKCPECDSELLSVDEFGFTCNECGVLYKKEEKHNGSK